MPTTTPPYKAKLKRALKRGDTIIPILTESVSVPESLDDYKPLNMAGGYKSKPYSHALEPIDNDAHGCCNRLTVAPLTVIGFIALMMFSLAIIGIMGGVVAFPVDEYNEEATYQAEWVNGLIVETLEYAQPRTTQDAENFEATLEAVPTRVFLFVRETATALPNNQEE